MSALVEGQAVVEHLPSRAVPSGSVRALRRVVGQEVFGGKEVGRRHAHRQPRQPAATEVVETVGVQADW